MVCSEYPRDTAVRYFLFFFFNEIEMEIFRGSNIRVEKRYEQVESNKIGDKICTRFDST